jgi:hypothetical protein
MVVAQLTQLTDLSLQRLPSLTLARHLSEQAS